MMSTSIPTNIYIKHKAIFYKGKSELEVEVVYTQTHTHKYVVNNVHVDNVYGAGVDVHIHIDATADVAQVDCTDGA